MLFRRVFSPSLDSGKRWYALTTEICGGPTKKYGNSTFTERFQGEIQRVRLDSVLDVNGAKCPSKWFDGGRTGGQLRLRELKNHGFVSIPQFETITKHINEFDLEELGGKQDARSKIIDLESQLSLFKSKVEALSFQLEASTKEMKKLQAKALHKSRGTSRTCNKISPPNFQNLPPTPISPGSSTNEMSPNLTLPLGDCSWLTKL